MMTTDLKPLTFMDIPVEVRDDVPPHSLYLINDKDFAMVKGINDYQDWGFIEFVRHSADYMLGSNPILFYLRLPIAWVKFDLKQRRDHAN